MPTPSLRPFCAFAPVGAFFFSSRIDFEHLPWLGPPLSGSSVVLIFHLKFGRIGARAAPFAHLPQLGPFFHFGVSLDICPGRGHFSCAQVWSLSFYNCPGLNHFFCQFAFFGPFFFWGW